MNIEFKEVENLDIIDYHHKQPYSNYWSSSNLKDFLISPKKAFFKKFMAEKKEPSESAKFGTLLHEYLDCKIKGVAFPKAIFYPPINPKTGNPYGSNTEKYLAAKLEAGDSISFEDMEKLLNIFESLTNPKSPLAPKIAHIFKHGTPEKSFFAEYDLDGAKIQLKYRPDVLVESKIPYIVDWKTINDLSLNGIQKAIHNYRYDLSASMYQHLEFMRTGVHKFFLWVFIENTPPYDFCIVDSREYTFSIIEDMRVAKIGAITFKNAITELENCLINGYFPGIETNIPNNLIIEPPKWFANQLIEIE